MRHSLIAGAATLALLSATSLATAEELTISIWGGFYGENWEEDVVIPWEEATGVDVTVEMGQSNPRLSRALATQGRNADIIFLTDHQMAILSERDLLQPVNADNVPNMANLYDFAQDPLGNGMCPAITLLGVGMIYNEEHFDEAPTSWMELASEDLVSRPAFMDMSFSVAPSVMLHLSNLMGGDSENMDPAFDLISDRSDDARFFQLFEVFDWMNAGEVSVAPMINIFARNDPSLPMRFTFPEDGMLGVVNMACILTGSENVETAERFLDYYLSQEVQEMQAQTWGEGPVVTNAELPTDTPYTLVPVDQIDEVTIYDATLISENREDWMERFQDAVLGE